MTSWLRPSCSPDPQSSQRELHRVPWPLNPEQQWPSEEEERKEGKERGEENEDGLSLQYNQV